MAMMEEIYVVIMSPEKCVDTTIRIFDFGKMVKWLEKYGQPIPDFRACSFMMSFVVSNGKEAETLKKILLEISANECSNLHFRGETREFDGKIK